MFKGMSSGVPKCTDSFQVLLARVTGGRRLTLSMFLWGAWGEVVCPALLFALVCLADLAAVVAPLDASKPASEGVSSSKPPLLEEEFGKIALVPEGRSFRSNCRSATAEMLVISMQAVLRASLLVTFRLAQRQRHAKVLP
ncbi:unnamed protein product [Cladocopium goreaui]|uniref:Uncharacterized protein n=1 Tax=Cladocopium goreaui TaxID=2562237 RepID=A0A9P1DEU3_9DINO|nr:unnamed protein product [Cladocopium goreaui]